ncbi:MAG: HEAT repeat domain-containing protein, partial [Planctomycetes bacterium]|nr:HEAT repeat domain-containing protein [Planctomycetota bacterium]
MRMTLALAALLVLSAPLFADGEEPAAYLAAARARHADLGARGLESFEAEISLRRSEDENLRRAKDVAGFGYSFKGPEAETFDFAKTHETLHKPWRELFGGLWRDLRGAPWFDMIEKTPGTEFAPGEPRSTLTGSLDGKVLFVALFVNETGELADLDLPGPGVRLGYTYGRHADGLRVVAREIHTKEKRLARIVYRESRIVSGFPLPTVIEVTGERNVVELAVRYVSVNGRPAEVTAPDSAEVAARLAAFEKEFKGLAPGAKIGAMLELSELACDPAASAIAKLGLKDRSEDVRLEAAAVLGVMGRAVAVPALLAALEASEKEIKVYLQVIEALGDIGDPRAIKALSKDWWNQRIGEYGIAAARAKIRALGKIRHVESVDALLDTFTIAKEETIGQLKGDLVEALVKLTGQNFLLDRAAWNAWWKKSRASFRF